MTDTAKILKDLGIVFKSVKFKNFMSFGNVFTTVELEGSGTNQLLGENLDKGGVSSGSGKSTLINAVSYCLFDKIPSNVSKDKLINRTNDKKNTLMEVDLTFTKGDDEYVVRRWRGASTGVQLLMNDLDVTPASVNRGEDSFNAKVEEIVGFSYNLFSQIILFNGNSQPFLDLSVGAQRALIEELFRITMLSRKAGALKKMIQELEKQINMQMVLIQQQQKQNEIRQDHLASANLRVLAWDKNRNGELSVIQTKLEALISFDYDSEEALIAETVTLREQIALVNAAARELTISIQSEEREAQAKKQSELRELNSKKTFIIQKTSPGKAQLTISKNDLTKIKKEMDSVEKELVHLRDAKCPYCLQKFEDAKSKILVMEQKLDSNTVLHAELSEKIDLLEGEEKAFDIEKLVELTAINAEITKVNSEVVVVPETPESLAKQAEIAAKTAQSAELSKQLKEIQDSLNFPDLNSLLKSKNEMATLQARLETMVVEGNPHVEAYEALLAEGEVKVDIETLDQLNSVQEHQQFLLKLLTDKNSFIRKNIISKTIPFLNKRIAYYTEKLNLPHIVLFQPDMSCEITQIGRELDHGNLSNGEKKMLNLSLCLSFRDVLTYLHAKVNVLFTDEVDGGSISGPDVDSLISMLKAKAWDDDIAIFIISHRPEFEGRCDRNLIIRKEGGFSTLILQPDA